MDEIEGSTREIQRTNGWEVNIGQRLGQPQQSELLPHFV